MKLHLWARRVGPLVLPASVGAGFSLSAGRVNSTLSVACLTAYFALGAFLRFESGLGCRATPVEGWFGSLGSLLGLGIGASFFVLFGYDGYPNSCITIKNLNIDGNFYKFLIILFCPAAAGIFVYYFLALTIRIPHPRIYLNIYTILLVFLVLISLLVTAKSWSNGSVSPWVMGDWTDGLAGLRLAGIICFGAGGLVSAGFLSALAVRMVFQRLVFDVVLMSAVVFAYFSLSAPIFKAKMSDFQPGILTIALCQTVLLIALTIAWTLVAALFTLVRTLLRRSANVPANANVSNPSLIGATTRSIAGLASNYSVLLFPIAWLAYRRNIAVLQKDLAGRLAITAEEEHECRVIAAYAALAHVLVLTIPTILALTFPFTSIGVVAVRTVGCAVGAAVCWRLLGRTDTLMSTHV